MLKPVLLLALLCGIVKGYAQQTYYYEKIAVVENGIKQNASGDGHFITFTSKGCYDSDKNGNDEGFGFRSYLQTSNDIQNYYGDSYFGKAYYYFSSDRSRLNIKRESDGTVYVYTRRTAPAGVTKSSRQKYVAPPMIVDPVVVNPSTGGSAGSSSSSSSSSSSYSSSSRVVCPKCNGRRYDSTSYKYPTTNINGWMSSFHNTRGSCPYCSRTDDHLLLLEA